MNIKKIISIFILVLILVIQLFFIFHITMTPQKTTYYKYKELKNKSLDKIEIGIFSFSIPQEWIGNSVEEKDILQDIKTYYLENDTDDYLYDDKFIEHKSNNSYQLIKKDDLYIDFKTTYCFIDGIELDYPPINIDDLTTLLKEAGFDTEKLTVGRVIEGQQVSDDHADDHMLFSVRDERFEAEGANGYLMIKKPENGSFGILLAVMSDSFYDEYPCADKMIAESLEWRQE